MTVFACKKKSKRQVVTTLTNICSGMGFLQATVAERGGVQ